MQPLGKHRPGACGRRTRARAGWVEDAVGPGGGAGRGLAGQQHLRRIGQQALQRHVAGALEAVAAGRSLSKPARRIISSTRVPWPAAKPLGWKTRAVTGRVSGRGRAGGHGGLGSWAISGLAAVGMAGGGGDLADLDPGCPRPSCWAPANSFGADAQPLQRRAGGRRGVGGGQHQVGPQGR